MEALSSATGVGSVRSRDSAVDHQFVTAFVEQQAGVYRLAVLLCGDRRRAEDVVAEAFARAYPHWQRGRVDDLGAYLRQIVVNEVAGRGRRLTLERREQERQRGATLPEVAGVADLVAERDRVLRALATLAPRQRAVVALRFYEDRTEADIASILGVSVGTVKSQLSRALSRLRARMEEDG